MSMAAPRVKFSNELETRITLVDDEHWKAARVGPWEYGSASSKVL